MYTSTDQVPGYTVQLIPVPVLRTQLLLVLVSIEYSVLVPYRTVPVVRVLCTQVHCTAVPYACVPLYSTGTVPVLKISTVVSVVNSRGCTHCTGTAVYSCTVRFCTRTSIENQYCSVRTNILY